MAQMESIMRRFSTREPGWSRRRPKRERDLAAIRRKVEGLAGRPTAAALDDVRRSVLDLVRESLERRLRGAAPEQAADALGELAATLARKAPALSREIGTLRDLVRGRAAGPGKSRRDEVMERENVPAMLALAKFVFVKSTFRGSFCEFTAEGMAEVIDADLEDLRSDIEMMMWAGLAERSPEGRSSFTLTYAGRAAADVRHPALEGYIDPRDYDDDGKPTDGYL